MEGISCVQHACGERGKSQRREERGKRFTTDQAGKDLSATLPDLDCNVVRSDAHDGEDGERLESEEERRKAGGESESKVEGGDRGLDETREMPGVGALSQPEPH